MSYHFSTPWYLVLLSPQTICPPTTPHPQHTTLHTGAPPPPICAIFIQPLRRSAYHAPPGTTPWPSKMLPPAMTATMGLWRQAGNDSPYHARKALVVA